jgi:Coenzyme PQQ synthesis protein D (PqqD)
MALHDTLPNTFSIGRIQAVYVISSGVRCTRDEGGGTVLDINQGKIFRLNGTGALIVERLSQNANVSEIIVEISRVHGISSKTVEADVIEFLGLLEKQGLVSLTESVASSCTN